MTQPRQEAPERLNSPLLVAPYEVRLAVYSHMNLPPFDGYTQIFGFFSCKQIREEIKIEARLRLSSYLHNIEEKAIVELNDYAKEFNDQFSSSPIRVRTLETRFLRPEVTVTLPFLLPPKHWTQEYEHRLLTKRLIVIATPILQLHLRSITFRFSVGDSIKRHIQESNALVDRNPGRVMWYDTIPALCWAPIGHVIHYHVQEIANCCSVALHNFLKDGEPPHTTQLLLHWNMSSQRRHHRQNAHPTYSQLSIHTFRRGILAEKHFTENELRGYSTIAIDAEDFLRHEKRIAKLMIKRQHERTRVQSWMRLENAERRLRELGMPVDIDGETAQYRGPISLTSVN
ncbi:hypothetical protein CC80DRAFT_487442 [Byssothecium circinans]|uniref:Uncharacterized protein n=1 Tax=Byssothecium circinans TaxID=147558 RepID=A0A6A5UPM4_9PLEO|nr:hypothetical protein CC80DRAFT_487442 [Byssothecium circinans]